MEPALNGGRNALALGEDRTEGDDAALEPALNGGKNSADIADPPPILIAAMEPALNGGRNRES
jgi:hypothetical protein